MMWDDKPVMGDEARKRRKNLIHFLSGFRFHVVWRTMGGEQLRIIEQNTKKATEWAEKAKAGAKIVWAFKGRAMFARLVDGEYTKIVKREI